MPHRGPTCQTLRKRQPMGGGGAPGCGRSRKLAAPELTPGGKRPLARRPVLAGGAPGRGPRPGHRPPPAPRLCRPFAAVPGLVFKDLETVWVFPGHTHSVPGLSWDWTPTQGRLRRNGQAQRPSFPGPSYPSERRNRYPKGGGCQSRGFEPAPGHVPSSPRASVSRCVSHGDKNTGVTGSQRPWQQGPPPSLPSHPLFRAQLR